ncbi:MAG: cytochrome c3 family protein [Isosphaerales bacterium]
MRHLSGQSVVLVIALAVAEGIWGVPASYGQKTDPSAPVLPEGYSCSLCHKKGGDMWAEGTPIADEHALADDLHWKKGLLCHDCHGGSPTLDTFKNHRDDPTFRGVRARELIPAFCGHCHSNITYMRGYNPSARTDQEAEYWTSGHGRRLKASIEGKNPAADPAVATCVDCHGGHGIRAVKDPNSPVEPTHVARTCARCHADESRMANRRYNGRLIGTAQYQQWLSGVHGQAMFKKGDRSAPTCNDCHGNHAAMPPGLDSVANACGTCHGKIAKLFTETRMKHKFGEAGLPGCATCHGAHQTTHPSDRLLGMEDGTLCARCHNAQNPQYGATTAGAEVARTMRSHLDRLKQEMDGAEQKVREAERKGMEVRGPRFDLRQAFDALTNARTLVHSFKPGPVEEAIDGGLSVTANVKGMADLALREYTYRRIWLAASLVPILLVVCLLLAYIRSLHAPGLNARAEAGPLSD